MQLQFITAEHLDIKPQLVNEASFVLACNGTSDRIYYYLPSRRVTKNERLQGST